MNDREWDDPQYKKWRLEVYRRDNFCCQMPGCDSKTKLQAHHIKRWADSPELRFQLTNGITLCKFCHKRIEGQEDSYQVLFTNLTLNKANRKPRAKTNKDSSFEARKFLYRRDQISEDEII